MGRIAQIISLLMVCNSGFAQDSTYVTSDSSRQQFLTMVNFNRDQSYLSLGNGIGNQRPILFEAQSLALLFHFKSSSKVGGRYESPGSDPNA